VKRSISSATVILVIGVCAALAMPAGVALAASPTDGLLCRLLGICPAPPQPPPPTTTGTTPSPTTTGTTPSPTTTATTPTTTTTTPTDTTPTTTTPTTTTVPPRECMPGVGEVDRRQVGPIRLGDPVEGVAQAISVPPRRTTVGLLRYCVRGGGRIDVTFAHGRAALIVARAQGYRYRGHGIGDSTSKLKKGKFGAKKAGGAEAYRIGKVLIGADGDFVTYIAPARGALLSDRRSLGNHLKRAGVR
jgi:hypothetical protein